LAKRVGDFFPADVQAAGLVAVIFLLTKEYQATMTKKEITDIVDLLESGGYEVQELEQSESSGNVSKCPSYRVRFQRKTDLEKERAADDATPWGTERPDPISIGGL
jgi:hypothetical protein